ncbi:MAG: hypothetical protein AB7P21_04075 [Lautropia sp.]
MTAADRLLPALIATLFACIWLFVVVDLLGPGLLPPKLGATMLALLMIAALVRASGHIRILAFALGLGASVLIWLTHDDESLWRGLSAALPFAAFLPTVVALRAAVELTPAIAGIRASVSELPAEGRIAWMTLGAHLLAAIITLGFVSVLRPMLPERLTPDARLDLARGGIRGLGLAVAWSPFFVASAAAAQLVPSVPFWRTVLIGLSIALIGMLIAHRLFTPSLSRAQLRDAIGRVRVLLAPTVLLVGAVVAISALTGWTSLQSIVVAVPLASAAYIVLRAGSAARHTGARIVAGAGRMGDEVIIMTASVVFGTMVAGHGLPGSVEHAIEALGRFPSIIIALQVTTMVGLGFAGLHPIVSASVLVPLTQSLDLPIAPQVLANMVTLAWALSSMISIWTLPVVVTSNLFEIPVRHLATGANLRFALLVGTAGVAWLSLLNGWMASP